jgi:dienelactone hydrolase
MKWGLFLACVLGLGSGAQAAVKTEEVDYRHDDLVLQGYFAYDDAVQGKRPAVMVVHEWWGHGPYARKRAEQLAGLGYLAFAADMYGKGVYADDHEKAGKLAGAIRSDRAIMRERALAGVDFMRKHRLADPARLAAVGYCFGGTTVLELARSGADLKGVASFHGALDTPAPEATRSVKAKVLVLHGGDDSYVNASVPAFQEEMRRAKADWQMISYGGAVHSFTVPAAGDDPSKGMAYDASADKRSWRAMKDFLEEVLK